jgi:LuxR family maltose regulon positive regulatory protein
VAIPILTTKLYVPPLRENIVPRPHLIERLNEGLRPSGGFARKLTLISAPAGFGKTTLVSEWVTSCGRPAAWLSLDEEDQDLARFLIYLVAALRSVALRLRSGQAANLGAGVLAALQSPQQPPTESILTTLLNEIASLMDDFILVLDDYHVTDAKPVDEAITFLLERQPPQMHLVLATREDPQLPLARYRARGQLTELRLADLRFSPAETAEFLNQVMGLSLSPDDIAALESRTEGWIAGLQLAALSMQGQKDTASFIQSFTGSHRFVLDYLVEEVLQKQPESIQNFLLSTSILDRLCGDLCDTVMVAPATPGQETLEYLERLNLFLAPLDNQRRWYRYHQLFAELLRHRLARAYPDQIADLHRRASDWYARNDLPNEAVTHALAIQDWPRAAEIIERHTDEWPMRVQIRTLLGWLESFPAEFRLNRTSLGIQYAWVLILAFQLERAEEHLNQLMPLVQTAPALLGELYVIRVMMAAYRSDMSAVIELAQQALSRVPPEEASPRSRILLSLGVAQYDMGGDIAAARRAFREAYELGKSMTSSSRVGNAPLPLIALAYLSEIEWMQGNLRSASRMYAQALELSEQWGGGPSIALCFVQWGRASLFYEWNNLDGAELALHESIRIGELWKNASLLVPSYCLSALVMQRRGQAEDALAMIRRAEQITRDSYSTPSVLGSLALYQIALWVAQYEFKAIAHWEQQHDAEWQSQIGRARDTLPIMLAHACIARYHQYHEGAALQRAHQLIGPALEKAQAGGLMFNVVRLLLLEALVWYAQGDAASAITALKGALALAEPENYMRSFLDLGGPMQELLSRSLESQALSEPHLRVYGSKLLSHFGADIQIKPSQPAGEGLIEPLSERELAVLRLVAQGYSNREIGERLFLAVNTVKGYNRIIFDKLQVQSRTEAVARARELGLF